MKMDFTELYCNIDDFIKNNQRNYFYFSILIFFNNNDRGI